MAQARPSIQELIKRRRQAGFVGRGDERASFRANFDLLPEDERHRFLFHVHGNAGVGKTFLVRELEQIARQKGALTAYVDESAGSVPEAMAAVSRQFAAQGHRFKELERLLAAHRERRHEAEAALVSTLALDTAPGGETAPSAGSMAAARAGLIGLGMVPGVGAFAGALDANQLAQGAERLRAGLSARFRSHEDVQLVLSPERVLTPVLLGELSDAASAAPSIALFFDTYERTGPFLDGWLHEVMTTDRHGSLPATVVVVTAGQHPFDTARWGAFADFMTDLPLGPFTEAEARGLLADKGVVDEPVVEEVLRLTGGLPLLVSTLAEQRPAGADDIGDPSATAVERFLKWEQEPVRRAAALACALPRQLDLDVFRVAVDCRDEDADTLFGWLRGLPFVDDRGDRTQYHDLVRDSMLRLQRHRSPRGWAERHERLAEAFGRWGTEAARDLRSDEVWGHEPWRALRLEEAYHSLCARPHAELGEALRGVVLACREGRTVAGRWARMLEDAGAAADAPAVREWGSRLREELSDDTAGVTNALHALLARPGLDGNGRALAHAFLGRELGLDQEYGRALAEYDRALELDPELAVAYFGRGVTHLLREDYAAALADLGRADELAPDTHWILVQRGEAYRLAGRPTEAIADFDRVIAVNPTDSRALAARAVSWHDLGQYEEALADFDRSLRLDGAFLWALVRRARTRRARKEWEEVYADLDRAAGLAPDSAWIASERGHAYRIQGRHEEAVAELSRAISLLPDYASALASRGAALWMLHRDEEALADFDRAVELVPEYAFALVWRARVRERLGDTAGRFADLHRAAAGEPDNSWASVRLGDAYCEEGRYEDALAVFRGVLERDPESGLAYLQRARVWLAIGRVDRALADLERAVSVAPEELWTYNNLIETLMLCGRWDETLARLADAERSPAVDYDLDDQRVRVYRHTGQWAAARRAAERLCTRNHPDGPRELALTMSRSQGLRAAESLWRELLSLRKVSRPEDGVSAQTRCTVSSALGDWATADRALGELLAQEPGWEVLAWLAADLTELLHSPGADRSRLAPRLAAVEAARDAAQTPGAGA